MSKLLEELKVRGQIQSGKVPELNEMLKVFSKKDAVELLRSTLIKLNTKV